jgi:hypothetical protein
MIYCLVVLVIVFVVAWVVWSVFVALGVLLFAIALALALSPFVLSGRISADENDHAIGDWPTIIDLDADREP